MKKNILLVLFSLISGVLFTIFILNKENIYAKEEYLVYAFQVGAYESVDNAQDIISKLPSGISIKEDNLYKVYSAMYKDIDLVNKMITYFKDNNINIYLKTINVSKDFYYILDNYEKIISKTEDTAVYDKVNQSILNTYLEGINND